ncbi:MAG: flagellar export chaperone FlgN [Gemmatimonadetes bacterium]|nr:flagellar export chaperone FlgN [Gemmatimonadota bacterium]
MTLATPRSTAQLTAMLVGALETETRLVHALLDVVRSQRRAVAGDDVDGLETANGAAHRILTTLNEARIHRSALNERLGESGELRLSAIAEWFGGMTPPALEAAVTQLAQAARVLDAELSINQIVFRAVAASADRQVRVLLGADAPAPAGYGADASSRFGRGVLLDWRG